MKKSTSWLLPAIAFGLLPAAAAQTNPADPAAAAPALHYQSTFSDYKAWQDLPPGDWRAMNDALRASPGPQTGHDRAPAAAPQAHPTPEPVVTAPAHEGRDTHGGQK